MPMSLDPIRQLPNPAPLATILNVAMPESEVYKALFDLSQAIAGHADLETLSNSLAGSLRRVIAFDFLALVLYDAAHDELRLHAVSTNRPLAERQIVIPTEGDHPGAVAWRGQKPLVLSPSRRIAGRAPSLKKPSARA